MDEFCDTTAALHEILLRYPGLVLIQSKNNATSFQGPIKVKDIWIMIKLICPNFPHITKFQLYVQKSFNFKIYTSADLGISSDWSIGDLIENLPTLIDPTHITVPYFENINDSTQKNIYSEIVKLYAPSEYEILLNDNCTLVCFTKFSQYEQHFLQVALPSLKLLEHSLPSCIDCQELFGNASSLTMLLQQFRTCLEDLRSFYNNFANIDELCHVVQPALPNYKANWRVFLLKERVFLKVQFKNPFSPQTSMTVRIIGPTSEVTQLRHVYSEGVSTWDNELDVHKNLLRIFDLCFFPMVPPEGLQTSLPHCNICYSYKLEQGEIPIVSCDNNKCSLIFHAACLKEWFNTLADGKTFLNVSFGVCPLCKTKLSTSFQEILK